MQMYVYTYSAMGADWQDLQQNVFFCRTFWRQQALTWDKAFPAGGMTMLFQVGPKEDTRLQNCVDEQTFE